MSPQQPSYSAEETARCGDEIYEREIRARVEAENHGKVVAIDIETGAYASMRTPSPRQSASALNGRMPKSGSCGSATARCTGSAYDPRRRSHDNRRGES